MSMLPLRPRRVGLRTAAIALGTAALLALGATAALAHDPLTTTNAYVPANGAVIAGELPATILVNFQDTFRQAGNAADPSVPVARVLDAAGVDHVASAVQNPNNAKQLVITTTDRTTPGQYTVTWTITASDGHAVSNDGSDVSEEGSPLVFTVRTSGSAVAKTSTGAPTATSSSNTAIATTIGVVVVILIAAGAILFWFRRRRDNMSQESDS
jgi:LPXTG-motif cell wall-anchored protein